jgi:hypothetical protein
MCVPLRGGSTWATGGLANYELESVTPELRAHPDVLRMRWHVYTDAKHWELALDVAETRWLLVPDDSSAWIHRSFVLHELKKTSRGGGAPPARPRQVPQGAHHRLQPRLLRVRAWPGGGGKEAAGAGH